MEKTAASHKPGGTIALGGIARRKTKQKAKRRRTLRLAFCTMMSVSVVMMVAATMSGEKDVEGTKATPIMAPAQTATFLTSNTPEGDYTAKPVVVKKPQSVLWTEEDVEAVAKTVWGESLITSSDLEMSAVVWCILNRVDSNAYSDSIMAVVTQHCQFHGYNEDNPVNEHIKSLVLDVFGRWANEKQGQEDVGRTLPAEYLFFWGDGLHNHFTTEYQSGEEWDWSLPNPYEN